MYLHPPLECVAWFHAELGWPYDPDEDGAVADWVISVVSTGFQNAQNAKRAPPGLCTMSRKCQQEIAL